MRYRLLLPLLFFNSCLFAQTRSFNAGWQFIKNADTVFSASLLQKTGAARWENVSLPHTANIEPIVKIGQQWQGICFYRKFFTLPVAAKGKHVALRFDAAMQEADVYLNGTHIFNHTGGYLPFYVDISDKAIFGGENSLVVKLDNRDNPLIPPGKPIKALDFNYYSGIYRDTWLIIKDKLYITDPVAADHKAGGGVFVHYEDVSAASATLLVATDVKNDTGSPQTARVRVTLRDRDGKTVAATETAARPVTGTDSTGIRTKLTVAKPRLWSPDSPYLYRLSVELVQNGKSIDEVQLKTGIRTLRIEAGAVYLNGNKLRLRGTNRHQEFPYVGYAASANAQFRDAWKVKQAGFNFVRSSHYPQSTAYLDACDELGILVMDAIPGWQYVGNEQFQQHSLRDGREMIRRDRNHPCIILWETSLNESGMKKDFMEKAHAIVHEELPFPGIYSAGWIDQVYDVFLPARQHGKAPDYWKNYAKNKPMLIAEYGDWEYYAQNAGFNQTDYKDLKAEERTSRQLRGSGEKRLLQQALNYQEAHNDNLKAPAIGDANWLMFDYNRGYAPDIESSGIMDITRLPKFAFYFYQSQANRSPMLFIANYWMPGSDTAVRVFSNCDEVELFVNGKSLGRQHPDRDRVSTNLAHPPFTFHVAAFSAGTLSAIGYINGKKTVTAERRTAAPPAKLALVADESGKPPGRGSNDVVFVYASLQDKNGTVNPEASNAVHFAISGDAQLVSPPSVNAEAGIATAVIRVGVKAGPIVITASAKDLLSAKLEIAPQR